MNWKHLTEYRDPVVSQKLIEKIKSSSRHPIRLMEVCGTHTMSISRNGLRQLLPPSITLLSGPGCPVCVTTQLEIDKFIYLAQLKNVIIGSFGDLIRVPGSEGALASARSEGADVRVVYSPMDCLQIADDNPAKEVVFLGVGFETTAPTIAAVILEAQRKRLKNFSVISAHKLVPPALIALLQNPRVSVNGFICPGHVSVIIGARAYLPIVEQYHFPCVIAGFEPVDILQAIAMLIEQIEQEEARVEIAYRRGVNFEGNATARTILYQVFEPIDADWRGLGNIPQSGLKIRAKFRDFDTETRFTLDVAPSPEPAGCICGEILCGIRMPPDCALFGKKCTPENPVGPCMVSSEGTCAAYFKYRMI